MAIVVFGRFFGSLGFALRFAALNSLWRKFFGSKRFGTIIIFWLKALWHHPYLKRKNWASWNSPGREEVWRSRG